MSVIEIVVLAVIQGLTEFLPISSSAHLLLPSQVLGWQDQGLAFDVAVHVGTLLAVVLYFRKDIVSLLAGWFHSFGASGKSSKESRLTWCIVVATIPFVLLAPLLKDIVELYLRSAWVIATSTIVFGLLLWYADVKAKQIKDEFALTWKSALILGLAQITAVIPGTSRSGITITAGLLLGLDKKSAARFSFLMSIPVISMMGLYYTLELAVGDEVVDWNALISGVVLSFISAYACIFFFLKVIERMGMMPFVIYRLILGIGLIAYLSWAS